MPTLGYWAIRGLAQPIRLLLKHVGEPFEDVKYEETDSAEVSLEKWLSVKYNLGLPIPNLPYYIDGDIKITQSNAILRYIARKHNLLGSNEEERVKVDVLLDQAMDFRNNIIRVCYSPSDFDNLIAGFRKDLPAKLKVFNDFLGKDNFFAGIQITVCDFPMYELLDQAQIMQPGCLDEFPGLKAFLARFEALPNVKAYMSSGEFMKSPINSKFSNFPG